MEPEELFKKPRIAFNALAAGNPTSAQLTQIRDFKENSKKYRNDMQQYYSLMISSLGSVPLSKVDLLKHWMFHHMRNVTSWQTQLEQRIVRAPHRMQRMVEMD
jgi:hypothetical protein